MQKLKIIPETIQEAQFLYPSFCASGVRFIKKRGKNYVRHESEDLINNDTVNGCFDSVRAYAENSCLAESPFRPFKMAIRENT